MSNSMCKRCGEFQAVREIYGVSVCCDCALTQQERFHEASLKKKNEEIEAYKALVFANDAKNLLERTYCMGCKKKMRGLTNRELKEFQNILDELPDKAVAEEFKQILRKHQKEKIIVPKGGEETC